MEGSPKVLNKFTMVSIIKTMGEKGVPSIPNKLNYTKLIGKVIIVLHI